MINKVTMYEDFLNEGDIGECLPVFEELLSTSLLKLI